MANAARCVYCRQRPIVPQYRPFCSERCKMADLGRWLGGDYRVPETPTGDMAADVNIQGSTEDPENEL